MTRATKLSAALVGGLMLWTGIALAQGKAAGCDEQGRMSTPEVVAGHVVSVDSAQGNVTLRGADGKTYAFRASRETLQDVKVGDRLEAKLREAPECR